MQSFLSNASIVNDVSQNYRYSGSCNFVKQVLPYAMATLLYNRCEFNPSYMKKMYIQNTCYVGIRSIVPMDHCLFPLLASTTLIQELIGNKCLKKVYLIIQSNKEESDREVYTFTLVYNTSEDDSAEYASGLAFAASAFFGTINQLKATKKHAEEDVKLSFYWSLSADTPRELANCFQDVQPLEDLQPGHNVSASFITNYHYIQFSTEIHSNQINTPEKKYESKIAETAKPKTEQIRNKANGQKSKEALLEAGARANKQIPLANHSANDPNVARKRTFKDAQFEAQSRNVLADKTNSGTKKYKSEDLDESKLDERARSSSNISVESSLFECEPPIVITSGIHADLTTLQNFHAWRY